MLMYFCRTDCLLDNLTSFISCGTSLTAINTWTKRDVNKRNVAKQNNINIKEFWKVSELENFLKDLNK